VSPRCYHLNPIEFSNTPSRTASSHMDQYRHSYPMGISAIQGRTIHQLLCMRRGTGGVRTRCPLCRCSVHFKCYTYLEGCSLAQYDMDQDGDGKGRTISLLLLHLLGGLPERNFANRGICSSLQYFHLDLMFLCRKTTVGKYHAGDEMLGMSPFAHQGASPVFLQRAWLYARDVRLMMLAFAFLGPRSDSRLWKGTKGSSTG